MTIILINFYWSIVALQCCVSFHFTAKRISYVYLYPLFLDCPEGVHKLERDIFTINGKFDQEHIFEGAIITMNDTEDHQFMAKVVKIEDDGVTIDTNHPLAGKALNFTGQVIENREATEEEIKHLIMKLTGGCQGCGHHGEGCGEDCGDGCGHHEGGCGHCHQK